MVKGLLLKVVNGILLVNCCNIGKAGATAPLPAPGKGDSPSGEGKSMKRGESDEPRQSQLKKKRNPSQNRLPPPQQPVPENEEGQPMLPPVIQIVCNARAFVAYRSEGYTDKL
jgi:hypothetical protein